MDKQIQGLIFRKNCSLDNVVDAVFNFSFITVPLKPFFLEHVREVTTVQLITDTVAARS